MAHAHYEPVLRRSFAAFLASLVAINIVPILDQAFSSFFSKNTTVVSEPASDLNEPNGTGLQPPQPKPPAQPDEISHPGDITAHPQAPQREPTLRFPSLLAIIFGLTIAAAVHFVADLVLVKLPKKYNWSRRLFSRISSIEGYWLEYIHSNEYPATIIRFEYDATNDAYLFYGYNYKNDFGGNAIFQSSACSVDSTGGGITFHFESIVNNIASEGEKGGAAADESDPPPKPFREPIDSARGYGKIRFVTEGTSDFVRGTGEFFERKPEPNWRSFELYRVKPETVKQALGRESALDDIDYKLLLVAVLAERAERQRKLPSKMISTISHPMSVRTESLPPTTGAKLVHGETPSTFAPEPGDSTELSDDNEAKSGRPH